MAKWCSPIGLKTDNKVGPKKLKVGVFVVAQRWSALESRAKTRSTRLITFCHAESDCFGKICEGTDCCISWQSFSSDSLPHERRKVAEKRFCTFCRKEIHVEVLSCLLTQLDPGHTKKMGRGKEEKSCSIKAFSASEI